MSMKELENNELMQIIGGGLSGAFLNYVNKLITTIFDIGKTLGSAIRRAISGKSCPI